MSRSHNTSTITEILGETEHLLEVTWHWENSGIVAIEGQFPQPVGVHRRQTAMGQVNLAKINPSLLLKHSERPALDPYNMPGPASMALLAGGMLGLGKTAVPAASLKESDFTAIDRTKVSEIAFPKADKAYKIVSRQDVAALATQPDKASRIKGGLKISDAVKFWAPSKFLILMEQ